MVIESEKDFPAVRKRIQQWKTQFPLFLHDISHIESIVEKHINQYSIHLVNYRQTKKKSYLEKAQEEIKSINTIVNIAEKMELMSLLSQ